MTESKKARPTDPASELTIRDLLQINATVIAGALILLTINATTNLANAALSRYTITALTVLIVLPFAGSSIWAFQAHTIVGARRLTQSGFIVLLVALVGYLAIVTTDYIRQP